MHPVFGLVFGTPHPPAPPRIPMAVPSGLWVDASNYTGAFTVQDIADLKNAGVIGVIPQAITGLSGATDCTEQCQTAAANGLVLMGYVWCFPGESVASIQIRLAMFNGQPILKLWADVEQDGLSVDDVNTLLQQCDAYLPRQRTGIYTGKWFFDKQGWSDQSYWADRDLWDSDYDGTAVVAADFRPYGGWTRPAVKQYAGTSSIGSVHQIDLDVA